MGGDSRAEREGDGMGGDRMVGKGGEANVGKVVSDASLMRVGCVHERGRTC